MRRPSIISTPSTTRASRRRFAKTAIATTGGVVAAAYIKPDMRSLGVPGVHAMASFPPKEKEKEERKKGG